MNINLTPPPPRLLANAFAPDLRSLSSQSANLLRITVIAFSLTLLVACGGGGGGTAAAPATPTPMTMMPGTGDSMNPPPDLEPLPGFSATQGLGTLQSRFSGTAPTITDETQIISGVQTVATTADTITMQDIVVPGLAGVTGTPITPDCSANTSCTASIPNVGTATFSLADIEDLSLIDDTNLEKFNSETRAVMDVNGVKVIESRSAGRDDDDTRLAFQTYAGWLDESVFGMKRIEITEGSDTAVYFASYSFGKASGSNPTGQGTMTWNGVAVGIKRTDSNHFLFQGTATIDIDDLNTPDVDVSISTIELPGSVHDNISWDNLSLTNGVFSDTNGFRYIQGSFYGDNQEGVGGIFRDTNLYGSFGATR